MPVGSRQTGSVHVKSSNLKMIWHVLKEAAAGWMRDKAMRLSAALSLYTILSLAPLLVVTIKIVSVVWRNHDEQVRQQLTSLMGPGAADVMQSMLSNAAHQGSGILAIVISSAVLVFAATGVFIELQDSMNTIWGVEAKPHQGIWGFVRNRLLSMAMVFGIAFLLLVSMFISTILTAAARSIVGNAGWIAIVTDIVVSLAFVTLFFAAIFKVLPDVKLKWGDVWHGALITSISFTLGKYALAFYFKHAAPTSAFGAAGSLAAVLLWIYYSGFILFFGAEFTKAWAVAHGHPIMPDTMARKVSESQAAQTQTRDNRADLRSRPRRDVAPAIESQPRTNGGQSSVGTYVTMAGVFAGGIGAGWILWNPSRKLQTITSIARVSRRLQSIRDRLQAGAETPHRSHGVVRYRS